MNDLSSFAAPSPCQKSSVIPLAHSCLLTGSSTETDLVILDVVRARTNKLTIIYTISVLSAIAVTKTHEQISIELVFDVV